MHPTVTAAALPHSLQLSELDTPALLVDLEVLDRNLARMADAAAGQGVSLRPHFKAHRLPEICRRQIALGAHGITCAKLAEAECLAELGFEHLLVANQVVGPAKWRRLAHLARHHRVTMAIDNYDVAVATAKAAREEHATVAFLVEVNVGLNRCGVATPEAAAELAVRCAELPGLLFRGVMGYEGHVVMLPRDQKEAACHAAMAQLARAAELCEKAGLRVDVVSAGGTGSWDITLQQPRVTELQCGTYSLMDLLFHEDAGARDFDYGCTVLTSVISRPAPDRAITDAGKKGIHASFGMSIPVDAPGVELQALHSEHGVLKLTPEAQGLAVGDMLRFIPYYLEGTVNLYDRAYAMRGGRVVEEWPISGRGRSQ